MTSPPPIPPTVDPEQVRAAVEEVRTALKAWAEAVAPAIRAAAQAFAQLAEAARTASRDDYALAPPRPVRRDRPAWQSPYGPPPRRRQH
ncbi:hypothetical protein ACFQ9U_14585 [Streptomyces sp. NPDC056568]|uniref:hypothetical protein n=1 Tax=Streptomyces sp. NPDC056568 TaxID=3345866 RepID=UPI0036A9F2E5